MVKTGYLTTLVEFLLHEKELKELKPYVHLENEHNKAIQRTTQELSRINQRGDLGEIISAEFTILAFEKLNIPMSKNAEQSLERTLEQYSQLKKSISCVEDTGKYSVIESAFSLKSRDKDFLPKDATRDFFTSQKTRIRNALTATTLSENEIKKYEQRIINIKTAENIYIDLQKKAVDSQGASPRQVFLDYPKSKENDTKAKALGAKFDKEQKAWYMMSDNPYLQPFQKEMSQQADANKAIEKSSKKDTLSNKAENTPAQTRKSTPKL